MKRNLTAEKKAAAAQTAFVNAAWSALSPKARRQLFSRRTEAEMAWAKRWNVDAPCMVAYARDMRALEGNSSRSEALGRQLWRVQVAFDRNVPVRPPPEWLSELQRLNKLPSWRRVGLSDKVAADYIEEYRRNRLVDDEDLLAPVEADPFSETMEHAVDRSKDHYRARLFRLRRIADAAGFTIPRCKLSPRLREHTNWIVRFQIRGESKAAIANSAGLRGAEGLRTVNKALHDIARLIGISLRKERRGRPRLKAPSDVVEAARRLRAELTRRFQQARNHSPSGFLYQAEVKDAIEEQLSTCSAQQRQELLSRIKSRGIKPSDAAARISARKFDLPLRRVRTGRVSVPRRRSVWLVQGLEMAEHRAANQHKGHHPRR